MMFRTLLHPFIERDALTEPAPLDGAAPPSDPGPSTSGAPHHRPYIPVRAKLAAGLAFALAWAGISTWLAQSWAHDLAQHTGPLLAWLVIFGIAIIPGFMNAFMACGLLMDRRPPLREHLDKLPGLTILVAAYNEAQNIATTLDSIARQHYPGPLQVIVIDDGSSDGTADLVAGLDHPWLELVRLPRNMGKAQALNEGLRRARHALTVTIDGDSCLYHHALRNLVGRYLSDPPNTRAVAGAVLVRNSRENLVARVQEWDYFHGIAAVKRLQSLYQGTLVAQGAFSLYETATLRKLGGWSPTVGEDIVLTWAMLEEGDRIGFAENACLFTNAPDTWGQFIRQRQRWSRGLIEAFKAHGGLLFKPRMSTVFIWWNLLFPYLDLVYTLAFIPGLVMALFGIYWIAGPMTLFVLPLGLLINYLMFRVQSRMFTEQGLHVRSNIAGFAFYALFYGLVLQPACVVGYVQELMNLRKQWGTK